MIVGIHLAEFEVCHGKLERVHGGRVFVPADLPPAVHHDLAAVSEGDQVVLWEGQ